MVQGSGLTVRLMDDKGIQLKEQRPQRGEPRQYRYRVVTAAAGSTFSVSLTIEKTFKWLDADTLCIAVQLDSGPAQNRKNSKFVKVYLVPQLDLHRYPRKYTFYTATTGESVGSDHVERCYQMPPVSDINGLPCTNDTFLNSPCPLPGCVSVNIHRGRMLAKSGEGGLRSTNPRGEIFLIRKELTTDEASRVRRREKAGKSSVLFRYEETSTSRELQKALTGNVCSFHFRNKKGNLAKTAAKPPTPTSSSQGIPTKDPAKKRKISFLDEQPTVEPKKSKKPKTICDSDDEDDEEVNHLHQMRKIKTELRSEEPIPVQAGIQHLSINVAAAPQGEKTTSDGRKRKKELEMRLRDIELEREALQVKRQLLEFDD